MTKDVAAVSVSHLVEQEKTFYNTLSRLAALEQNMGCIDGKIIGTGQSDYTKGSTAYTLFLDDNAFALIDIPGIEGDESKYREIIKASLAKAHVIFYVNGSGKMIEKDSLEKIKAYMHDGTSVYALFNVHVKGQKTRIPGIDKTLQEELAEAYEKSKFMQRTEEALQSFLGDNFKGSVSLNGLLSFCSLAMDDYGNTTIVQDESKYLRSDQAKFLKEYTNDSAAMREDSHISQVQDIITDKIDHFDEYIQEENLKKLRVRLSDMLSDVRVLQENENKKIKDFLRDYEMFQRNCETARDDGVRAIGLIGRDVVEAAFLPVQERLYTEIEQTGGKLKESAVEMIFAQHKEQIAKDIQSGVNRKVEAAVEEYRLAVQEAEKRLLSDIQRSQSKFEVAMGTQQLYFDASFTKALKISGKDLGKGALKIAGYGAMGFRIGTWIPGVGNIIGAVVGVVVGLVMAVLDIFTSRETRINRAKERLKDSLDNQIAEIVTDIKGQIQDAGIVQKVQQPHASIQSRIQTQRDSFVEIQHIMQVVEIQEMLEFILKQKMENYKITRKEVNQMKANELKITDIRVADIDGLPKHMILIKVYTNDPDIVGYGEVRDASSATYAKMLKSRLVGENPLNVEKLFNRIKQFGGHSRQGGGVSGIEIALFDIVGKFYKVPVYQLLGGKYRDKVRIYCDTDVDGKHTGRDMGKALKKRMEDGFTYLKMDLGIELLYDEPGTLNAPVGMLEEMQKYSMKAIQHQSGSIDMDMMLGNETMYWFSPGLDCRTQISV